MLNNCWDQQSWDDIMAVNYTGAISLAEQILPVLADGAPARHCY
jgi:NAD(P)-dependent dehydrogenase (short-subunit alcohol dehydrogenase family)